MPALPRRLALLACLLLAAAPAPLRADDLRDAGRKFAKDFESAIVTIDIVIGIKSGNDEGEQKTTINGTVVDETGLTLVPLEAVDPASMYRRFMGAAADEQQIESRVKDIKIKLNKKEVPASVVLTDSDLNIAFLRPNSKPEGKLKFFDFKDSVKPQLLDQVVSITRMSKIADNVITVMTGEIQAQFEKPRAFYVPSSELASAGMGVPVLTAEGKLVGVVQSRVLSQEEMADSGSNTRVLAVILPAEDVVEMISQAPASEK